MLACRSSRIDLERAGHAPTILDSVHHTAVLLVAFACFPNGSTIDQFDWRKTFLCPLSSQATTRLSFREIASVNPFSGSTLTLAPPVATIGTLNDSQLSELLASQIALHSSHFVSSRSSVLINQGRLHKHAHRQVSSPRYSSTCIDPILRPAWSSVGTGGTTFDFLIRQPQVLMAPKAYLSISVMLPQSHRQINLPSFETRKKTSRSDLVPGKLFICDSPSLEVRQRAF